MSKPDWITLSKSSGSGNATVTVTAAKNPNKSVRSGQLLVKSGSITKTVQLTQAAHKDALVWLTQPSFEGDLSSSAMTVESDAPEVQYLQNGVSFDKSKAYGYLTRINGGSTPLGYKFDSTDSQQKGLALSMQIVSYDTKTSIAVVSFELKITDYEKLEAWFNDKYQGSGSTSSPHYGEMSFVIGGLLGEDGKEVRSDEITLKIYAPASAVSTGTITLTYAGDDISSKVSIGQTIYESIDGWNQVGLETAEFYQPIGTIKQVDDSQLVIDLSSLTQSDVDRIYSDLYNGDQIEMDMIYFGVSSEDDPEASWTPLLVTTEVGSYDYVSQNVAEVIKSAFAGTNEELKCTSQETVQEFYTLTMSTKLCTLTIPTSIFSSNSVSQLTFHAVVHTTNGKEIVSGDDLVIKTSTTASKVSADLWVDIDEYVLTAADSISHIEIVCNDFPNAGIIMASADRSISCYNNKTAKSYSASFVNESEQKMYFIFGTKLPIVKSNAPNNVVVNTPYSTVTISDIG